MSRLNDTKTQESYYNKIVERYMKFCASSTNGDDLDKQFSSLTLKPSSSIRPPTRETMPMPPTARVLNPVTGELFTILSALRKLREAITATSRHDQFAQRAYIFNIHAAILCNDWESYAPALLTLLQVIHLQTPLSTTELHEFVGYFILDLACRQGDLMEAYEAKSRYKFADRRVELGLKALANDNWVMFWKMKKAVDGYQRRIMQYSEKDVRLHALKSLLMRTAEQTAEKWTGAGALLNSRVSVLRGLTRASALHYIESDQADRISSAEHSAASERQQTCESGFDLASGSEDIRFQLVNRPAKLQDLPRFYSVPATGHSCIA